jgi:hypothetical protein
LPQRQPKSADESYELTPPNVDCNVTSRERHALMFHGRSASRFLRSTTVPLAAPAFSGKALPRRVLQVEIIGWGGVCGIGGRRRHLASALLVPFRATAGGRFKNGGP